MHNRLVKVVTRIRRCGKSYLAFKLFCDDDILASTAGSLTSAAKIRTVFKSELKSDISLNTVKSYIDCLKDAFWRARPSASTSRAASISTHLQKYYFKNASLRKAPIWIGSEDAESVFES